MNSVAAPDPSSNEPAPLLAVTGLSKQFGDRLAVDAISFAVARGECVGFLGPNGAGKTTTINMLLGLVTMSAGAIQVFDLPVPRKLAAIKAMTGVVPQADSLDPDLTVEQNLLLYASYYSIPRATAKARTNELLHFFALESRRGEVIGQLSGGQRRRLLLARALINDPLLLILDEPTIGLDPQARHLMWERLQELKARGTTILLTSHYLDEVARLSDRVLIIDHGRIVAQGEPRQLITDLVGIEVFEVEGTGAELDQLAAGLAGCEEAKIERAGDTLYLYAKKECRHIEALLKKSRGWLRRPANLEDLFIRLTGRSLRES
jgi:lipooligosaccharide transport system ATP-binding protein